jgi:hypothetical protein
MPFGSTYGHVSDASRRVIMSGGMPSCPSRALMPIACPPRRRLPAAAGLRGRPRGRGMASTTQVDYRVHRKKRLSTASRELPRGGWGLPCCVVACLCGRRPGGGHKTGMKACLQTLAPLRSRLLQRSPGHRMFPGQLPPRAPCSCVPLF